MSVRLILCLKAMINRNITTKYYINIIQKMRINESRIKCHTGIRRYGTHNRGDYFDVIDKWGLLLFKQTVVFYVCTRGETELRAGNQFGKKTRI
jgi:hypothetical protein